MQEKSGKQNKAQSGDLTKTLTSAIQQKNGKLFPYPVLIITIYLSLGFIYKTWHTAWILFLTIPLYYFLIRYFRRRKNLPNN